MYSLCTPVLTFRWVIKWSIINWADIIQNVLPCKYSIKVLFHWIDKSFNFHYVLIDCFRTWNSPSPSILWTTTLWNCETEALHRSRRHLHWKVRLVSSLRTHFKISVQFFVLSKLLICHQILVQKVDLKNDRSSSLQFFRKQLENILIKKIRLGSDG